ncbi:hypothetical protein T484DRAFT_1872311, partial [Baffinella frigidus]
MAGTNTMRFPSSADMAYGARNTQNEYFNVVDAGHTSVRRRLRRATSCGSASSDPEELVSLDTTSSLSRTGSEDSLWRKSDLPVARQHRRRMKRSFRMRRHAHPVLPKWPTVDNDAFASSKLHLLSFDLDPTTLPSDVLCHLALEMFVSAGLPAGLAEHRVRHFIFAVRASMLDNPYHNFYHVFD